MWVTAWFPCWQVCRLAWSRSVARLVAQAVSWLSSQAGSWTACPHRARQAAAVLLVWQPGMALSALSFLFAVLTTGLPLTMLNPTAVSFTPMFSALHGEFDPVAVALSQVGLPTSVYGHFLC